MKSCINYTLLKGNLGDNPRYVTDGHGRPRFTFDVCVSKPYKDGDEWKTETTWYRNCIAWGDLATILSRMQFAKGDLVLVEGEMKNNDWVNRNSNESHYEMQLKVYGMSKISRPAKSNSSKSKAAPAASSQQACRNVAQADFDMQNEKDLEDLPF